MVEVADRSGSTVRMPDNPWQPELPVRGKPAFRGEDDDEILLETGLSRHEIADLKRRKLSSVVAAQSVRSIDESAGSSIESVDPRPTPIWVIPVAKAGDRIKEVFQFSDKR